MADTTPIPISERISLSVLAALQSVRPSNGYVNTLHVTRYRQHGDYGDLPLDRRTIIFEEDPEQITDGVDLDALYWNQEYAVVIYIVQTPEQAKAVNIDTEINLVRAEAEKAVMADYQRGGLAINTYIRAPQHFAEAAGAREGITVRFAVQYHTQLDNPFAI